MSYQEKRTLTTILTGLLVMLSYGIYVWGKYNSDILQPGDLRFWAVTMLVFMGIWIATIVLIQVIFHILFSISIAVKETIRNNECADEEIETRIESEMLADERDKLIGFKSMRVASIIFGIGFVGALVSILGGGSAGLMLNIIYLSFFLGQLLEAAVQFYYYRAGV